MRVVSSIYCAKLLNARYMPVGYSVLGVTTTNKRICQMPFSGISLAICKFYAIFRWHVSCYSANSMPENVGIILAWG